MQSMILLAWCVVATMVMATGCQAADPGRASRQAANANVPPPVPREFRGVWIATVANIDWPSKRGLDSETQKAELIAHLDRAAAMNLNAVVFQVRPAADALYASPIEPWSEYLTGEQGRDPGYDPLQFAIDEAHQRGLELHAWFNPYRAGHASRRSEPASTHISQTRPDLVRQYGNMLWLDPAEPEVQDLSYNVFMDVVRRYDIDGVHIDDYFYPYPVREDGQTVEFPDDAAWQRYQAGGGRLTRGDWRRAQVNAFVERVYKGIKREKPHVQFGISPFGIWQPGHPAHVKGMNQYEAIYADARLWLQKGWCDYFTPQLYWTIRAPDQSFISLLEWWQAQNPRGRHLWPGLYTSRTQDGSARAFDESEIRHQVEWTRILLRDDAAGHIHFSMKALAENRGGLADTLSQHVYQKPALVPGSPWLGRRAPAPPRVALEGERVRLQRQPAGDVRTLVVQARRGGTWDYAIHPLAGGDEAFDLPGSGEVEMASVFVVDRNGLASRAVTLTRPAVQTAALGR